MKSINKEATGGKYFSDEVILTLAGGGNKSDSTSSQNVALNHAVPKEKQKFQSG